MEQVPEDEEHMWAMLQEVLKGAAENFVETRLREGENLKNDLIGKLDHMLSMVDFIEERSPEDPGGIPAAAGRQGTGASPELHHRRVQDPHRGDGLCR